MKKYILILLTILSLSVIFYFPVSADTYEELTYLKSWDGITITGCSENSTNIIIPSMIDGLPCYYCRHESLRKHPQTQQCDYF